MIPTCEETRTVSKNHARIFPLQTEGDHSRPPHRQRWMLQDLNTLNGTGLNGMDLMPGGTVELHDGDEIVLSSIMRNGLRVRLQFPDDNHSRLMIHVGRSQDTPQFGQSPTITRSRQALRSRGLSSPSGVPSSRNETTAVGSPSTSANASPARRLSPALQRRKRGAAETTTERTSEAPSPLTRKRARGSTTSDDKERFMVCPVCLDYFHNSATLACSHTFCGFCISHWFRTSATLSCPECRHVVKQVPVRNRALDELVAQLVGDTDAYQAVLRKRMVSSIARDRDQGSGSTASSEELDLRTHPLIFSRWSPDAMIAFSSFIGKQLGETRLHSCRQIGLTEAAIEGASAAELMVAAQNLLIDCMSLRGFHEASDRLKIFLQYG
ncbi:hypothetical protein PINS_up001960 [Pythium insidiosum]|nr:hypothetical protein PINS_up001960 [Pythium insidiosum]